jgi:DNA-binding transcriptional LysR family regulator
MLVALPADHALARQAAVSLGSLRDELFILYPRANGRAMHDAITCACRAAGFDPKAGQGAPQMTSTINLVATGIGVSIVPASMAQLNAQGVTYKQIEGPAPQATMALAAQTAEPLATAQNFNALVLRHLMDQAA